MAPTMGDLRIPVEVKYRNTIRTNHYDGFSWFISNPINRALFGILITKEKTASIDERIITVPLKDMLLLK